jgi:hypothetical protein
MYKEAIDEVGAKKTAALVTDNAAACKLARQLTVESEGYKHILSIR